MPLNCDETVKATWWRYFTNSVPQRNDLGDLESASFTARNFKH